MAARLTLNDTSDIAINHTTACVGAASMACLQALRAFDREGREAPEGSLRIVGSVEIWVEIRPHVKTAPQLLLGAPEKVGEDA